MECFFLSFRSNDRELKCHSELPGDRLVLAKLAGKELLEVHEHRLALALKRRIKFRVITMLDLVSEGYREFEILALGRVVIPVVAADALCQVPVPGVIVDFVVFHPGSRTAFYIPWHFPRR